MPAVTTGTKRERTRALILKTAAKLFATHGYTGVSMDSLGKAAKLTKGALYDHFGGKEDVFVQSVSHYIDTATHSVREAELPGENDEERLFNYLDRLAALLENDPILRRLYIRLITEPTDLGAPIFSQSAFSTPLKRTVELISAYRPDLNAVEYAYSFLSTMLLSEDLKGVAGILTPEYAQRSARESVLNHIRQTLRPS